MDKSGETLCRAQTVGSGCAASVCAGFVLRPTSTQVLEPGWLPAASGTAWSIFFARKEDYLFSKTLTQSSGFHTGWLN